MNAHVIGLGLVSPQETRKNAFLENVTEVKHNYLNIIEPDYKKFIQPGILRRLCRILKFSAVAAKLCIADAGMDNPGAIVAGTGMGCLEFTDKFLVTMVENQEKFLNPSLFISSTHNAIASQIAILMKCHDYNMTYTHRTFSFETALMDAIMLLENNEVNNVMVGGVDELIHNYIHILDRVGVLKKTCASNLQLLKDKSTGTIAGEGAVFLCLSNTKLKNQCPKISLVHTFYKPHGNNTVEEILDNSLKKHGFNVNDMDLVILGLNGDNRYDQVYYHLMDNYFKNNPVAYFKHLCGEYHTASSFALWMAINVLKYQYLPPVACIRSKNIRQYKNVLVYNQYKNVNHSVMVVNNG